jgi:uncharacterized protein (TIGR03435 family)
VPPSSSALPAVLFSVWLCGFTISVTFWFRWWRQIHSARHSATPLHLNLLVPVAEVKESAEAEAASDPSGPSIFTALQQQLGLKLEPRKVPGEILVIDHVERPSEN